MLRWLGQAFTLVHGLAALVFGLLHIWLWARSGFRFPRYIHVMAFFALLLGWSMVEATAETDPLHKMNTLTAFFVVLMFPAIVYGTFVFFGGALSTDDSGSRR